MQTFLKINLPSASSHGSNLAIFSHVQTDVDADVVRVGHFHGDITPGRDVVRHVDGIAVRTVLFHIHNFALGAIQNVCIGKIWSFFQVYIKPVTPQQ